MKNIWFLFVVLITIACTKNNNEPLPVDFSKIKVAEINEKDSCIYTITYRGDLVSKIEKTSLIDFNIPEEYHIEKRDHITDVVTFYYTSSHLDSALRIVEFYRPYDAVSGRWNVCGFSSLTCHIKFIYDSDIIVQKKGDISRCLEGFDGEPLVISTSDIAQLYDNYTYNEKQQVTNFCFGAVYTYNQYNNISQECVSDDCLYYKEYDHSPNPYKAINLLLKYPFFEKAIYLSDNNPLAYEATNHPYSGKKEIHSSYQYDSEGRVMEIDGLIKIKYH